MNLPFNTQDIFSIKSETDFGRIAIELFNYQYTNNEVYHNFCDHLKVRPDSVSKLEQIPFLPIEFFKTHTVLCNHKSAATIFYSSGTSKNHLSQHHVADLSLYDQSLLNGFELAFGPLSGYSIFALLPSYHANKNASLLYMVQKLIDESGNTGGFYLDNFDQLIVDLASALKKKKVILIGVSYALLDLAEMLQPDLSSVNIIETGGMKGRRKELIKSDLHAILKEKFNAVSIGSEYGMTELLSQAWSKGNGVFHCPPWMKVLTREYNDPLTYIENKTGGINVIDLANIHSCSFIATQDLGIARKHEFEIIGRFDHADIRGCNLLVS